MKRETRVNLIFLALLLMIMVPVIFKLTKRAYRSGGRDPAMRPAVRTAFAYMDPTPPAGLPRTVPPGIARFVQRMGERLITMQPGLRSIVSRIDAPPLMSDRLNLQVLAMGASGGKHRVGLFGWNSRYAPLPVLYEITGTRGDESVRGEMLEYEQQNLPIQLRSELQEYGYIVPPDSVLWLIATFPGEAPVDAIRVHYQLDNTVLIDTITLRAPASQPATATALP